MSFTLLILVLPLVSFLLLGLSSKVMPARVAGIIGTLILTVVAGLSYSAAYQYFFVLGNSVTSGYEAIIPLQFTWLEFTDSLHIDLGILLDPLSAMMLVVISTVSLMVHLYSMGYMHGERGFQRYFAYLSLFTFSMLGLVVATNIFQMYIFWELVGVSSYLLIGFYYTKPSAVSASKKAFIVTRFADLGFLIGILILSYFTGTFDFASLTADNAALVVDSMAGMSFMGLSVATWAMALIFMGGAGKSAMFPLHIWLPDAMEGPTPVSALIHAATMVVAGVYLVARMFVVYYFAAPDVLILIAYIGAFTALFSAIIALTQTDIKRVLAFSTISQIAYMMVALGVSDYGGHDGLGYMASMFHLFTHAFFKALLFLGAGSIIHAVHSNEMQDMGDLRRYMPITHITFLLACLAIAGIPPFSGFFSKDEILLACFEKNTVLFGILWVVAGLTAFYMFRLYYRIFWGKKRNYEHTPHESPWTMSLPLIILAILTVGTGFIPFADFISSDGVAFHTHIDWGVASASIIVALIGIGMATLLYKRGDDHAVRHISESAGDWYTASKAKFYMDEAWLFVTKKIIFGGISKPIAWFDKHVVDGTMDGIAKVTQGFANAIKNFQSGNVQFYLWVFMAGVLLISLITLFM